MVHPASVFSLVGIGLHAASVSASPLVVPNAETGQSPNSVHNVMDVEQAPRTAPISPPQQSPQQPYTAGGPYLPKSPQFPIPWPFRFGPGLKINDQVPTQMKRDLEFLAGLEERSSTGLSIQDKAQVAELVGALYPREVTDDLEARSFKSFFDNFLKPIASHFLRRDEGSDDELSTALSHLLNSREVQEDLAARGLFSKLLPIAFSAIPQVIDMIKNKRDLEIEERGEADFTDDELSSAFVHLMNSREIQEDLAARGIFSKLLPFAVSAFPQIIDMIKNKRELELGERAGFDEEEWERMLNSRALEDYNARVALTDTLLSLPLPIASPAVKFPESSFLRDHQVKQRRAESGLDIQELERLLGRELTEMERRGERFDTNLGRLHRYAPLLPVAMSVGDWFKNSFFPPKPQETAPSPAPAA
ncbi:hypothetical protein ONZ45_g17547 [Pleurotus djamor]|nr:hypothetical protein ONZ45_g17547 [Pleurotus djamor]